MHALMEQEAFRAQFARLESVSLNPARHAASNAHEHCLWVAERAKALAVANGCNPEEESLLANLGVAHDLGKLEGDADPKHSVALLRGLGIDDENFLALVRYHDTNLPWYRSFQKGQAPSPKAWKRLARKVDLRLLCLFMVADRVDCPGGWKENSALCWFLEEARTQGLLTEALVLDVEGEVYEVSAGCALVRGEGDDAELLVIRVRQEGVELPKGRLAWDESLEAAAARELQEETGLETAVSVGPALGSLSYAFEAASGKIHKRVHYFLARAEADKPVFGKRPKRTRERTWLSRTQLDEIPVVSEELRQLMHAALS